MLDISSSSLTEPLLTDGSYGSQKKTRCHKPVIVLTLILVTAALIAASTDKKHQLGHHLLAFLPLSVELHGRDLALLENRNGSLRCSTDPNFSNIVSWS